MQVPAYLLLNKPVFADLTAYQSNTAEEEHQLAPIDHAISILV